jgi:hypothetical protein
MHVADDMTVSDVAAEDEPTGATTDEQTVRGSGDAAWFVLDQVNHSIRFADTKASVLLAASGVLGGLILSQPPGAGGELAAVRTGFWGGALVAVTLSALAALAALVPRLRIRRTRAASLLYFGDIARRFRRRPAEFATEFRLATADPDRLRHEVMEQIWANSLVARRKFRYVAAATWLVSLALISGGVAFYLERH